MRCMYKEKIDLWDWYDAECVNSTNDEIKNLVSDSTYAVISAKHQNGGRGRRGKQWTGVDGNLYFTYSYNIPPQDLSRMVCIIGLCLAKTVKKLMPDQNVQIKWPNDVFLNGKKLSGILLENIKDNLWAIGIGVNIVGVPKLCDAIYEATSLKECGLTLDRTDFLRYYLVNFASETTHYDNNGFAGIKKQWLEMALNYQKEITIKTESETKCGVFLNLDDNGFLILKTKKGQERIIAGDLFV